MLDAVVAALAVAVLVATGLALLYAVTVVPFLLAVGRAERQGFAVGRWATAAIVAVVLALALAALVRRAGLGAGWLLPPLALAFLPAAAVTSPLGQRWGGRAGRHEPPL